MSLTASTLLWLSNKRSGNHKKQCKYFNGVTYLEIFGCCWMNQLWYIQNKNTANCCVEQSRQWINTENMKIKGYKVQAADFLPLFPSFSIVNSSRLHPLLYKWFAPSGISPCRIISARLHQIGLNGSFRGLCPCTQDHNPVLPARVWTFRPIPEPYDVQPEVSANYQAGFQQYRHLSPSQPTEQQNFIQTIEKFRAEEFTHHVHDGSAHRFTSSPLPDWRDVLPWDWSHN